MNFKEYFYSVYLERNEYGKILSWLSPHGQFHPLARNQLHDDWAEDYISSNNITSTEHYASDYLMKIGWCRVTSAGKEIIIENDYIAPNSSQRNKLIDMAHEYNMKSIEWARQSSSRIIWSNDDVL